MTSEERIKELEEKIRATEQLTAEATARAEAAEAKFEKAQRDYEISEMWIKVIEESQRKAEEAKIAEMEKAVEAAKWRKAQNDAARAERLRWENMTPEQLKEEERKCKEYFERIHRENEEALLKKYGTPEAVAEFKKKQEAELAVMRAEREEMLRKKKEKHDAYLRMIGVIDD